MKGTLKVTTSELRSTSTGFDGDRGQISSLMNEMNSLINGLSSSWQGDAYQAYVNSFKGLQGSIQTLDRKIKEHVTDLIDMADVYDQAENKTAQEGAALPKDAIS